jgi:hypothetical protein
MRPEAIPELEGYPHVHAFVRDHLAMQFGDVRAMLRLPLPSVHIENGCNFAAAGLLCDLVSGISVVLFNRTGNLAGGTPHDRGGRFRGLLKAYFPWRDGENRACQASALYSIVRNPLAHSLGVLRPDDMAVHCLKSPLTEEQVSYLDVAWDGERTPPPALQLVSGIWMLDVALLYAAELRMLRHLVSDAEQMKKTESCLSKGLMMD